jgi:hypothetical protein
MTQALGLGGSAFDTHPAAGGRGRSKICNAAPQKVSVKSAFKVPHVRLKLKVPEL